MDRSDQMCADLHLVINIILCTAHFMHGFGTMHDHFIKDITEVHNVNLYVNDAVKTYCVTGTLLA